MTSSGGQRRRTGLFARPREVFSEELSPTKVREVLDTGRQE
jgi:hypothetical protein